LISVVKRVGSVVLVGATAGILVALFDMVFQEYKKDDAFYIERTEHLLFCQVLQNN